MSTRDKGPPEIAARHHAAQAQPNLAAIQEVSVAGGRRNRWSHEWWACEAASIGAWCFVRAEHLWGKLCCGCDQGWRFLANTFESSKWEFLTSNTCALDQVRIGKQAGQPGTDTEKACPIPMKSPYFVPLAPNESAMAPLVPEEKRPFRPH